MSFLHLVLQLLLLGGVGQLGQHLVGLRQVLEGLLHVGPHGLGPLLPGGQVARVGRDVVDAAGGLELGRRLLQLGVHPVAVRVVLLPAGQVVWRITILSLTALAATLSTTYTGKNEGSLMLYW